MDQEAIKNEETKAMQSARDDAQRVLQAAERVQQTAEQNVAVMRTVAIVAVAGLVLVALVHAIRGVGYPFGSGEGVFPGVCLHGR